MSDFSFPFSVNLNASGNGQIDLTQFFVDTWYQVFNIGCNVPGAGLQQTQVLIGNIPFQQSLGGSPQLGPIYLHGQSCVLQITGGTPNSIAQGMVQGAEDAIYENLPNLSGPATNNVSINGGTVSLSGPVSVTGPVTVQQPNPASLLIGGTGPILVENQTVNIAANSNATLPGVGQWWNMNGYAAILLLGQVTTSPGGNVISGRLNWSDGATNFLQNGIDSVYPRFSLLFGAPTNFAQLVLTNLDAVNAVVISHFTAIPLPFMPPNPAKFLLTEFGLALGSQGEEARLIIANQAVVAAGASQTFQGVRVWPGRAIWAVGQQTGGGSTQFDCTLQSTDAIGNVTLIARAGGVALATPMEVSLLGGSPSIIYHNNGAGNQNAFVSLVVAD